MLGAAAQAAAQTQTGSADEQIRATIARWYAELAKKDKGRPWMLVAPGFIDSSPHYDHIDNGSAALGPRVYTSLPAQAMKFAYTIGPIRRDASFAKVRVDERGYFYAWAAQKTYERAVDTDFILERQGKDGRWLILAHQSGSYGIAPGRETNPMPDLRAHFYATEGKDRDPAKDAEAAKNF
ncbi:MAG: hypothetical protein V4574_00805 [Pseudomonadota bacterium]